MSRMLLLLILLLQIVSVSANNLAAGEFSSIDCIGAQCVAVAPFNAYQGPTQIYHSNDAGLTWSLVKKISAQLRKVTCMKSKKRGVCVAVGESYSKDHRYSYPSLYVSYDNGVRWSKKQAPAEPGEFIDISCTSARDSSFCVAVGRLGAHGGRQTALIYQSPDDAKTWNQVENQEGGVISSTSCTETKEGPFCTATSGLFPILNQTRDGGKSWKKVLLDTDFERHIALKSTSCTDKFCNIVGEYFFNLKLHHIMYQTHNGGKTWDEVELGDNTTANVLTNTRCFGKGNNTICIALGSEFQKNNTWAPMYYISLDAGKSWKYYPTSKMSEPVSVLTSASCIGEGDDTFCLIIGGWSTNAFLTYLSNETSEWSFWPITAEGPLFSTKCTKNDEDKEVCIVAGYKWENQDVGEIYQTQDHGLTWVKGEFLTKN